MQTAFDQHFVGEAARLLYDKSAQIEAELAKFSGTVAEYAKKTVALRSKVDQLTSDLTERDAELVTAEKQKKQGDKSLEKATQFREEKDSAEGVGTDAEAQYKFLLERTGAAPAEEAPAAEVEAS